LAFVKRKNHSISNYNGRLSECRDKRVGLVFAGDCKNNFR